MSEWTSFQDDPTEKAISAKSGSIQPDSGLKPISARKIEVQSKLNLLRSVRAALKEAHQFQDSPKLPSFRPSPSRSSGSSDDSDEDTLDWSFQDSSWLKPSPDQGKVKVVPKPASDVKLVEGNPPPAKLVQVSPMVDLVSGVADQPHQNPGQWQYDHSNSWSDSELDDISSSDSECSHRSSSSSSSNHLDEKYRTFPREWLKSFQKKYPQTGFPVVLDQ